MTFRASRPRASATERSRVVEFSQQDAAQSAAYSQVDPLSIPEVKIWLRVDLATNSGTLSVPDARGGSSATQPTGANKPTLGTTSNGLAKLTNASGTGLLLPMSAGHNNSAYFAIAFWCRPTSVATTSSDFYNAVTAAGASANRISIRQDTDDLKAFVWVPPSSGGNIRNGVTTRAVLRQDLWKFVMYEFDGSLGTEDLRSRFKDAGTPLAFPQQTTTYGSTGTAPAMPTSLEPSVTGNSLLFNRATTYLQGFLGDVGPDIFFYDPRTMTDTNRVRLAQFRVPVG